MVCLLWFPKANIFETERIRSPSSRRGLGPLVWNTSARFINFWVHQSQIVLIEYVRVEELGLAWRPGLEAGKRDWAEKQIKQEAKRNDHWDKEVRGGRLEVISFGGRRSTAVRLVVSNRNAWEWMTRRGNATDGPKCRLYLKVVLQPFTS